MIDLTAKGLVEALKQADAPLSRGDYHLNLVGIRSAISGPNRFDDTLAVLYEVDKRQHLHRFPMTTDPGLYYLENPINVDGTAILAPGFYPDCWQIGAHRGQYRALVQRGPMRVFRDADRDAELDPEGLTDEGLFGINLHRANANHASLRVDKWSAGCQVLADPQDFALLMALADKAAALHGPRFSYTLLEEDAL